MNRRDEMEAAILATTSQQRGLGAWVRRTATVSVGNAVLFGLAYGLGLEPAAAMRVAIGGWCLLIVVIAAVSVVLMLGGSLACALLPAEAAKDAP